MPFYIDESVSIPGKYLICVNHEKFKCKRTLGSYSILPARVLGLTYDNYLRYARDVYGAELYGKNTYYPLAYFKKEAAAKLVQLLNKIAAEILKEN